MSSSAVSSSRTAFTALANSDWFTPWADQPFIWHIYPQDDDAHHAKLEAFLDWMQAPESLRKAHRVWNGMESGELTSLNSNALTDWTACAQTARKRLLQQTDLVSQLMSVTTCAAL
ncbi:elongation factor P maturation arginine rhamnosyltransferase EarP [Limnohabitans sp. 15K]|uniref:elongation factor P maturation arginine rhamnosyltransferase EarP n=1 Tax=Limnohabitans sp. 15K TaxID=1100706 RepID=UPI001179CC1F|nr:elongation factor P maturation arginine rhamnosyltransferase EarP [Limnohabitans sp. 15K]